MDNLFSIIRLIIGLGLTVFIGYVLLSAIFRKNREGLNYSERIFVSFGLGIILLTMEQFFYSILKIEWSIFNIIVPWVALFIANLFLTRNEVKVLKAVPKEKIRLSLLEKFLISIIVMEVIYVFFKAFSFPLSDYDGLAIYGIKAKSFYLNGTVFTDMFTEKIFIPAHPDYPLLLPLAESWVYIFLGSLNDYLVKILFPVYYVGLLVIFFSVMLNFFKRREAILFTFFVATVSQLRNFGYFCYAEMPLIFYYTASFLYLFMWIKKEKLSFLILSALMAFGALWSKNEGSLLFLVNLAVLLIAIFDKKLNLKKALVCFFAYLVTVVVLFTPWVIVKTCFNLTNDVINKDTLKVSLIASNLDRIGPILYEYQKHIFGPKKWNIVWILIIMTFILKFKNLLKPDQKYFTIALILCFLGYTMTYFITPQNLTWHLSTSASRIILHFLPIGLFWVALCTRKELDDF